MRFSRRFSNRVNYWWMSFWTLFILLTPLIIAGGLVWKSSMLLSDHGISELLGSSSWKPMSGHFGFSHTRGPKENE